MTLSPTTILPCICLILPFLLAHCRTTMPQDEPSQLRAETDDTPGERTSSLVDVSTLLENRINHIISVGRAAAFGPLGWTPAAKESLLRYVYDHTGAYRPGTGIKVGVGPFTKEASLHPEIVYWLDHHLDANARQILRLAFDQTKYSDNALDPIRGKVISHKTRRFANHSIAPIIRIRDVILGTDKIGHFFMQGYWYWAAGFDRLRQRCEYGQFMEGNPVLFREKRRQYKELVRKHWIPEFRFGYFGAWSTGVISLADGEANEQGYQFYKGLYEDPSGYVFRMETFDAHLPLMNEAINPNKYAHGIKVREPPPDPNRPKDSCWKYDPARYAP